MRTHVACFCIFHIQIVIVFHNKKKYKTSRDVIIQIQCYWRGARLFFFIEPVKGTYKSNVKCNKGSIELTCQKFTPWYWIFTSFCEVDRNPRDIISGVVKDWEKRNGERIDISDGFEAQECRLMREIRFEREQRERDGLEEGSFDPADGTFRGAIKLPGRFRRGKHRPSSDTCPVVTRLVLSRRSDPRPPRAIRENDATERKAERCRSNRPREEQLP